MILRGWIGTDLNGLRRDAGTYGLYPLESLPPLAGATLDGSLSWLVPLAPELDASQAIYRPAPEERVAVARRLESLVAEAAAKKLALPAVFRKLMASPELQDRFPSSTACTFSLPAEIAPAPAPLPGGHLVRFLDDQQGCFFWYLWLKQDGTDAVVASGALLDSGEPVEGTPEMFQCADSLEEFLYRTWVENTLWFALGGESTLTEAQGHYARHYRK